MKYLLATLLILPLGFLLLSQVQSATLPSIQAQALEIAYEAGVAFQPPDWPAYAHPFPVIVQAILMQESSG